MRRLTIGLLAAATTLSPVGAQQHPYGGYQTREIKALSDEQIAGLRAGSGMTMALPAELNRYPGPLHVLEHATALGLSVDQIAAVEKQRNTMNAEAVVLGEQIIVAEGELDALFRTGAADANSIQRVTSKLSELPGTLRVVHLRTHLDTRATLTEHQIATYQSVAWVRLA